MSSEIGERIAQSLVIMVLTAIVSFLIYGGLLGTSAQVKSEAVERGHAEWRLDSAGRAEFHWFDCGKK